MTGQYAQARERAASVAQYVLLGGFAAAGVGRAAAIRRGAGRRRGARLRAGTGSDFAGSARYSRKIRAMDAAW